jgi:hypothetical protein
VLGVGGRKKEEMKENLGFIAGIDFIRNKRAFQQVNLTLSIFFKRVTFDTADIFQPDYFIRRETKIILVRD